MDHATLTCVGCKRRLSETDANADVKGGWERYLRTRVCDECDTAEKKLEIFMTLSEQYARELDNAAVKVPIASKVPTSQGAPGYLRIQEEARTATRSLVMATDRLLKFAATMGRDGE